MRLSVRLAAMFLVASCSPCGWPNGSASAAQEGRVRETGSRAEERLEAKLDSYLTKATSEVGFSGAVLVARGEGILLHEGYGWADLKKTSPVKAETKFYIASITKQFTAAAVLKLEEMGRLSVRDTISKYLKDVPPDKAGITVHHLLTHTSGLAQNYAADGIDNREEAVRAILRGPLKSSPGELFRYTNDGYNLLAVIVEIASGQTYEAFLRRRLLRPAGMSRTGFWGEVPAKGEQPVAQAPREISQKIKSPNWGFRGATGMYSTAGDLYKWHRALSANKVLKSVGREKLMAPHVATARGDYGYGWFISQANRGPKVVWTAGTEGFGHNAIIKTYPDGTVIIVTSNAGNISGAPARDVISTGLEGIIYGNSAGAGKTLPQ